MALDRGTLTRIDRRVFAELDHTGGVQAVKVPVSDAMWSTWRRCCEAIGLSMGEGVAGLIAHELETVVSDGDDASDVLAEQVARRAEERASRVDARERELDTRAERLRRRGVDLEARQQQAEATSKLFPHASTAHTKIGRNERCPCASGLKYKRCHGLSDRRT